LSSYSAVKAVLPNGFRMHGDASFSRSHGFTAAHPRRDDAVNNSNPIRKSDAFSRMECKNQDNMGLFQSPNDLFEPEELNDAIH
jgi:hypothetical protein